MIRKFLAVAALASIALAGCNRNQQAQQYAPQPVYAPAAASVAGPVQQVTYPDGQAGVQQCIVDGNSPALCQQSYASELAALPHYSSYGACQSLYGPTDCYDHGGWFGPALGGFLIGHYIGSSFYAPPPLYVGPGGYMYSNGYSLGYIPQHHYYHGHMVYVPQHTIVVQSSGNGRFVPAPAVVQRQAVVQRNGFGGVAQHTALATPTRLNTSTVQSSTITSARPGFAGPAVAPATSATVTRATYQTTTTTRSGFGGGGFGSSTPTRSAPVVSSITTRSSTITTASHSSGGFGFGGGSSSSSSRGGFGGGFGSGSSSRGGFGGSSSSSSRRH